MSLLSSTTLTRELETFYTITSELVQSLDLPTVLEGVLSRAVHLLQADESSLFLYEPQLQHLRMVASYIRGRGFCSDYVGTTVGPGEGVAGKVWQAREAFHVTDYVHWKGRSEQFADRGIDECFGVPLFYRDECLGVLLLSHARGAPRFTERQRYLLTYFAAQAATAIGHARLFAQERKKTEQLTLLHAIVREITTPSNLQEQLNQAVTLIQKRLGYRYVSLFLLDRHQPDLATFHTCAGIYTQREKPEFSRFPRPVQGLVRQAALIGATIVVGDVRQDPTYVSPYQTDDPIRSELCVPLKIQEEVIGVLNIEDDRLHAFDTTDVQTLEIFSDLLAHMIERARFLENTQQQLIKIQALYTTAVDLTQRVDTTTLLEAIVQRATELLGAENGALFLLDESQEWLISTAAYGVSRQYLGKKLQRGEGLAGRVLMTGEPMIVEDYTQWEGKSKTYQDAPFHQAIAVPLIGHERVQGVLVLNNPKQGKVFTQNDQQILLLFAQQATFALEKARVYKELLTAKTYLTSIMEHAGDAILTINTQREITSWNEAAEKLFGYTAVEVLGQSITFFHPPKQAALIQEVRDKVYQQKQPYTYDTERLHKDGTLIPVSVTISPILDERGEIKGFCSIYRDLRKRKQLEQQFIQAEKFRALGEMANGIAHNFNNLLATILGRTQLLLDSVTDKELQQNLQIIEKAALDGAETVRHLQQFSRQETSSPPLPMQLNNLITEALEMTRPRWKDGAQQQGIQITPVLELSELPLTMGHPIEIKEVLIALILNALDAMPQGGKLSFRTWQDHSTLYCSVSDTGLGIPPQILNRIFEPFFTTKEIGKGTGMGLSTVYGILAAQGGTITVNSQEGEGTTFTFSLPLKRPSTAIALSPLPPSPALPVTGRILVIEDEEPVRTLLSEILQRAGHQVTATATGKEALASFQQQTFDLVITDLGLPEINGWEVARQIRQSDTTLPIIMVTGWGLQVLEQEQEKIQALQIERVIAKPFDITGLLHAVQEALTRAASSSRSELNHGKLPS